VLLTKQEFFDAHAKLIWHEDEPIAWPSSIPLYFVSQLASTRVRVVLTGEGSDETLAGYARYAFTLKNIAMERAYCRIMPRSLRHAVRRGISQSSWLSASGQRKLSHTFLAREGDSWQSFYFDNFFSAFGTHDQKELLVEHSLSEAQDDAAYQNVLEFWDQAQGSTLQQMLYTDIKTYLVELLMKQDNMSMAASVESRVPFLDHQLVEFALTIPAAFQLRGTSGKHILKRGMEDLLPPEIIYSKKLGFPTPWSSWLSGAQLDHIEKMLLEPRSIARGVFKGAAIKRLFREHRES
jgi:asparagine synthase (glutamine-hydrolysing)